MACSEDEFEAHDEVILQIPPDQVQEVWGIVEQRFLTECIFLVGGN